MKPLVVALALVPFAQALALSSDAPVEVWGVVSVAPPPGPSTELTEHARAVRTHAAALIRGVLAPEELRDRMGGPRSTASLSELDRAYAGAVSAYQAGDFEASVRTLRAVIDDLEKLPESEDAHALWTRTMLRLARAEGSLGRKGEERDLLARLVRGNPQARADPELYPPSFSRLLEELRAAQRAAPQRRLSLTGGARGARAFVEGRAVGEPPLSITLPPGRYRVSGLLGDVRVTVGLVDLTREDQSVALDFSVAETFRPVEVGLALSPSDATAIVRAGATLGLDRVISVSFMNDGDVRYLSGALHDVRRGALQREGRVRLVQDAPPRGALSALTTFLLTGEPSSLVIASGGHATLPLAPPRHVPIGSQAAVGPSSNPLGWAALGLGVVALGVGGFGVYQGSVATGRFSEANAMLTPSLTLAAGADQLRYTRLVSDGDGAATAAWISAGGAGAALIAGGILGYLSYQQSKEIGPIRF